MVCASFFCNTAVKTEKIKKKSRHAAFRPNQRAKGDDLEDALQREEGCEQDVEVLQHGLVQVWCSIELGTERQSRQSVFWDPGESVTTIGTSSRAAPKTATLLVRISWLLHLSQSR